MLPSKYRLPLRGYQEFFDKAQREHTKHFIVYSLDNDLTQSRFAVIVPAKVANKATLRNQLRRQVLAKLESFLEVAKTKDYVIYVKKVFDKEALAEIKI